jgi:hypothetical protein
MLFSWARNLFFSHESDFFLFCAKNRYFFFLIYMSSFLLKYVVFIVCLYLNSWLVSVLMSDVFVCQSRFVLLWLVRERPFYFTGAGLCFYLKFLFWPDQYLFWQNTKNQKHICSRHILNYIVTNIFEVLRRGKKSPSFFKLLWGDQLFKTQEWHKIMNVYH